MTTLVLTLDDELSARLQKRAESLGVTPEDLARQAVKEQLESDRGFDEEFERAANHILEENAELYRRLA
jgi:predicted transcriptional regulator